MTPHLPQPFQVAPPTLPYQPTQPSRPIPQLAPNTPNIRGAGPPAVLALATGTPEIFAFYENVQGRYEGDPYAVYRRELDFIDYRAFVETEVLERLRRLAAADATRAAEIRNWLRRVEDQKREGRIDEEEQL